MFSFLRSHLDPSTRLGEAMFGLIMALGISGAVRVSSDSSTNRELFIAILGCNLAWGVVDGVMFAMLALFERSRNARIVQSALHAPSDEIAIERIDEELGDRLERFTTPEERKQIYGWVLKAARESKLVQPKLQRDDILGAFAVGMMVLLITFPVLIPFLIFANPLVAARVSSFVGLGLLFLLGWKWGRAVEVNPIHTGVGVAGVGLILVMITIALGG